MTVTFAAPGSAGPAGSWPSWVVDARYDSRAYPGSAIAPPIAEGANCQRFAYGVLGLVGLVAPPHRSSELWGDDGLHHVGIADARDFDLVLFNRTGTAWGAHVGIVLDGLVLHLCAEVGRPALWTWDDFGRRERYRTLVGVVRVGNPTPLDAILQKRPVVPVDEPLVKIVDHDPEWPTATNSRRSASSPPWTEKSEH